MIEVNLEISQREKHLTGLAFRRPQVHPDETIPVGDVACACSLSLGAQYLLIKCSRVVEGRGMILSVRSAAVGRLTSPVAAARSSEFLSQKDCSV